MASITFQYRSKKDEAPLEVRLTYKLDDKHTSLYVRSKITVEKSFWNEYRKGTNFRDADKASLKKIIDDQCHDLETYIIDRFDSSFSFDPSGVNKDWLIKTVEGYYNPVVTNGPEVIPDNLLQYWEYYMNIRGSELTDNMASYRKWMTIFRKLERFQKAQQVVFKVKDVNEKFKTEFVDYCRENGYSNSTIIKDFAYIKTVCRHARTKKIEVSHELDRLRVKIKKKSTAKIYLSFDELDAIGALQGMPDYLDNARDWLIISCYTGQRISDFMRFDKSMIRETGGNKYLEITQKKTGKEVTIPLIDEVVQILNKRDGEFPRAISHQRYNEWIKVICKKAGLTEKTPGGKVVNGRKKIGEYPKYKLIGSHVGRRSYATNFYGLVATVYLKNVTGHGTEQMFLEYIGKDGDDTAPETLDQMQKARNQQKKS